jgi:SAM-dependent methyltransferase
MESGSWPRFVTATSRTRERKLPCEWPGILCQNAQSNRVSMQDAVEVELRLWSNPSSGVGWSGSVIDSETISSAQKAYPSVKFVATDVICAGELFPAQFDIIYAFNAFYAFPDQQAALRAFRLAAKPASTLCLFDYLDRGAFKETPFARKPETLLWRPLSMTSLRSELDQTGWSLREWTDISQHYDTWYHELVQRFAARRSSLLERFSAELVAYAEDYYCSLLETISGGALGGAIVYAQAKPRNS